MRYSPEHKRFYNDEYYYKDREYKPSRRSKYVVRKDNPMAYLNRRVKMAKYMEKYDCVLCESGWTRGQGWGGLYKAWQAYIISMQNDDMDSMENYAKVIRKIQEDLKIAVCDFPNILKTAALEYASDPENRDLLREEAERLNKDPDDLNSGDVLNIMLEQDRLAYELAGMQY